jgi:CIC family chloride channel protein
MSSLRIRWIRQAERVGRWASWLAGLWGTPYAARMTLCTVLVGLLSGLGAVAFLLALHAAIDLVLGGLTGLRMPPTGYEAPHGFSYPSRWWLVALLPAVGGLASGLIIARWAPEAEGDGTDALVRTFHLGGGLIRTRIPFVKGLASIVTIATGGSAAQEGPTAQIGAGLGSWLARAFNLPVSQRRILVLAGAAGGLGAIFRAPLGGALYATEVLYGTTAIEAEALLPCIASSIVAFSTFALFITPQPIFRVPPHDFHGLRELPMFGLLALACVGFGWIYVHAFHAVKERLFGPLRLPRAVKPALGGLLVGLLGLAFPEVLATGYGWLQWGAVGEPPDLAGPGEAPFVPNLGMRMLLALALVKIAATSLTIGSGGSGGVFGPSIFIGGMLGGGFGQLLASILPSWDIQPSAFVLVGMGGFFAGVSKTPLTSILMVCEISGSYSLLVPLMLVCGIHLALSTKWSLYREQVPSPIESAAHQGDFIVDVLEQLRVADLPIRTATIETFLEDTPFDQVRRRLAVSSETLFPIVDREGRLTGIFSLRDVRLALMGGNWDGLVVADDLATRPVLCVHPDDDLHLALRRLTELNADEIPVVRPDDPSRLLGLLSRRSLVAAYSARVQALQQRREELRAAGRPGPTGPIP